MIKFRFRLPRAIIAASSSAFTAIIVLLATAAIGSLSRIDEKCGRSDLSWSLQFRILRVCDEKTDADRNDAGKLPREKPPPQYHYPKFIMDNVPYYPDVVQSFVDSSVSGNVDLPIERGKSLVVALDIPVNVIDATDVGPDSDIKCIVWLAVAGKSSELFRMQYVCLASLQWETDDVGVRIDGPASNKYYNLSNASNSIDTVSSLIGPGFDPRGYPFVTDQLGERVPGLSVNSDAMCVVFYPYEFVLAQDESAERERAEITLSTVDVASREKYTTPFGDRYLVAIHDVVADLSRNKNGRDGIHCSGTLRMVEK